MLNAKARRCKDAEGSTTNEHEWTLIGTPYGANCHRPHEHGGGKSFLENWRKRCRNGAEMVPASESENSRQWQTEKRKLKARPNWGNAFSVQIGADSSR